MLGTRIFTISAALLSAATFCFGAAQDYFPLQTGNTWVYRPVRGLNREAKTIEVGQTTRVDGREYYNLKFFGRDLLVRNSEDVLYAYDAESKTDKVWINFAAPEGDQFDSSADPCTKGAKIESRAAKYNGPIGDFSDALRVVYVLACADAGTTSHVFLRYVGLVQHSESNIAGEIQYNLVYARNGLTTFDPSQISFTVSLDGGPVFVKQGDSLDVLARMTLRNTSTETITLNFRSGQSFDVAVVNEKGERVYVWSADKLFIQALRTETLGPGEKTWTGTLTLGNLPPGKYTAEAYLTSEPKQYSGSVGFEIRGTGR